MARRLKLRVVSKNPKPPIPDLNIQAQYTPDQPVFSIALIIRNARYLPHITSDGDPGDEDYGTPAQLAARRKAQEETDQRMRVAGALTSIDPEPANIIPFPS